MSRARAGRPDLIANRQWRDQSARPAHYFAAKIARSCLQGKLASTGGGRKRDAN